MKDLPFEGIEDRPAWPPPFPETPVVYVVWMMGRMGFCTTPLRKQCTQILILVEPPPGMATWIFWMFGLNLRAVMPVIFFPTPPDFLALPRREIRRPATLRLPQNAHILDIDDSLS
jgi:hypothetical protein